VPRPFFDARATRGDEDEPRRRLLLVTYHFPPDSAVGGLRWERHAAFLALRRWDVDVISRDFDRLGASDDERLRCLSDNVTIYSAREYEPFVARAGRVAVDIKRRITPSRPRTQGTLVNTKELPWVSNSGIVRAHAALVHIAKQTQWANEAAVIGRALSAANRYDVVASSGPPHMAHEAARVVATRAGVPLIVDLRDPWAGWKRVPEDYASPLWFTHARRFERRAVRDARLVVMNTELASNDMAARYPWAAERIVTIRNGSDDEPVPTPPDDARFTIRFAGTIYLDRDPRLVFRAAAAVVRRLQLSPEAFRLEFMGEVGEFGGRSLLSIAAEEGLEGFVGVHGRRPRSDAQEFLAGATMLLSLPQYADLCVPAKIFEYTRFDAWVLILATRGSATARVFAGSDADVVDPGDVEGMTAVIASRYAEFRERGRPQAIGHDGRFERKRQAELLAQHLESISPDRRSVAARAARVGPG
jgi:hypothetical protein